MRHLFVTLIVAAISSPVAQAQQPNVTAQREAMKKLEFLAGNWKGPAVVTRGTGPLQITQSETVRFKLDGLVLLIEGEGRNAEGKVVFGALATVAFDEATSKFRFRAHSDGHFLDTEQTVETNGFSWGYTAGPLKVANTMTVSEKGEWVETTESSYNGAPPRRSVEMKLQRMK